MLGGPSSSMATAVFLRSHPHQSNRVNHYPGQSGGGKQEPTPSAPMEQTTVTTTTTGVFTNMRNTLNNIASGIYLCIYI
jgi:hypothetical protein